MIRLADSRDVMMAELSDLRMHVQSPCVRCGTRARSQQLGPWVRREDEDGPGWAPLCDLNREHLSRRLHPSA